MKFIMLRRKNVLLSQNTFTLIGKRDTVAYNIKTVQNF